MKFLVFDTLKLCFSLLFFYLLLSLCYLSSNLVSLISLIFTSIHAFFNLASFTSFLRAKKNKLENKFAMFGNCGDFVNQGHLLHCAKKRTKCQHIPSKILSHANCTFCSKYQHSFNSWTPWITFKEIVSILRPSVGSYKSRKCFKAISHKMQAN